MAESYRRLSEGQPSDEETGYNWMDTYGDLVTLLLCFFVLLFAMSNIDRGKFDKIADSFSDASPTLLNGSEKIMFSGGGSIIEMKASNRDSVTDNSDSSRTDGADSYASDSSSSDGTIGDGVGAGGADIYAGDGVGVDSTAGDGVGISVDGTEHDAAIITLYTSLESYIAERDLSDIISISRDSAGIKMIFADSLFFDSGKADLKNGSTEILLDIIPFFEKFQGIFRAIKVEGHTDSRPISNWVYKNNWWLSNVRALNVAEYVLENSGIEPSKISCEGRGEYLPIADNTTPEGRAKNRRVELVLAV